MPMPEETRTSELLRRHEQEVLSNWIRLQQQNLSLRNNLVKASDLEEQCRAFLRALLTTMEAGGGDVAGAAWSQAREILSDISRNRARQGFTPTETAMFVFSLKEPAFDVLRAEIRGDELAAAVWELTQVLDQLGLYTAETYQKGREEIINRQQQELMELSTPVVQLWRGVLALPLIGTLDSARTQVVMESLLQAIVDTGSSIAIIDITGVPVVDTLVAQHLLKTVAAARLMGADCIISGIRPQIAQTIVHLGVEINDVPTKATIADAFAVALSRIGLTVTRRAGGAEKATPPKPAATE
ncbi:MAG TPA: STAS domain-containing protein [Thermoanaerobaculia bacterium]|nr:STAS domain-containing protein [Thermoanaerobaculia bacterium]